MVTWIWWKITRLSLQAKLHYQITLYSPLQYLRKDNTYDDFLILSTSVQCFIFFQGYFIFNSLYQELKIVFWLKLRLWMFLLTLIWTLNFDCLCSVLDWSGFDSTICIYVHYGWWKFSHLLIYATQQISVVKIKDFKQTVIILNFKNELVLLRCLRGFVSCNVNIGTQFITWNSYPY